MDIVTYDTIALPKESVFVLNLTTYTVIQLFITTIFVKNIMHSNAHSFSHLGKHRQENFH